MKSDKFHSIYDALISTINSNTNKHKMAITKVSNSDSFKDDSVKGSHLDNERRNHIKIKETSNSIHENESHSNKNELNVSYKRQSSFRSEREKLVPMKESDLIEIQNNALPSFNKSNNYCNNNINPQENSFENTFNIFSINKHKTPHLQNKENIKHINSKNKYNDYNESFLFASYSNRDINDISNEDLLISLIQCVRIPLFPLKYSEYSKVFKYSLLNSNKEYKLLSQFFIQFNLNLAEIRKFYCLEKQEKYFNSKDTEITEALLLFAKADEKSSNFYLQNKDSNFQLCLYDNPMKITDDLRYYISFLQSQSF